MTGKDGGPMESVQLIITIPDNGYSVKNPDNK